MRAIPASCHDAAESFEAHTFDYTRSLSGADGRTTEPRRSIRSGGSFLYPPSIDPKGIIVSGPPVILFFVPALMNKLSLEHFDVFDRGGASGKLQR